MNEELILGTECKVKITLPKVGGYTPYQYEFDVELYVNPKKRLVVEWGSCIPVEGTDGNFDFIVPFDSAKVGVGDMTVEVVAYIPDGHFEDGLRTERIRIESVATIIP